MNYVAQTGIGRWSYSEKLEMAKRKDLEIVHLVCQETGHQNYTLRKKRGKAKLEVKKFCPALRKHTLHVEKRK